MLCMNAEWMVRLWEEHEEGNCKEWQELRPRACVCSSVCLRPQCDSRRGVALCQGMQPCWWEHNGLRDTPMSQTHMTQE